MLAADVVAAVTERRLPPWRDPVQPTRLLAWPVSARTGQAYSPKNALPLLIQGRSSPIWGTEKTWKRLGGCVMPDAVPLPIFSRYHRRYLVYNETQVSGLRPRGSFEPEEIRKLLERAKPKMDVHFGRPMYCVSTDTISMPPMDRFVSQIDYWCVVLHELAHWTGHATRLNRVFGNKGTAQYAKEEMIAELASMILGASFGVSQDDNFSYVYMWWKNFFLTTEVIVEACKEAERIVKFLRGI